MYKNSHSIKTNTSISRSKKVQYMEKVHLR